jgi:hypothetical protein
MTGEGEWKQKWEAYASEELRRMQGQPVESLLAAIRRHAFGEYHTIGRAVAERATLAEAGWTLYDVLESQVDYLPRYHCAAALLRLLNEQTLAAVDLSGGEFRTCQNLPLVRAQLEARIGPHP